MPKDTGRSQDRARDLVGGEGEGSAFDTCPHSQVMEDRHWCFPEPLSREVAHSNCF